MSGAEVRPGNQAVVHHANVYVREPGSPWLRDYPYGKLLPVPEEKEQRARVADGVVRAAPAGEASREQVIPQAPYSPGRPARQVPPGYGMLIPAGSDLACSNCTTRRTARRRGIGPRVWALSSHQRLPEKRVIRIQASKSSGFVIPPGAASYPVSGTTEMGVESELLDVYPHMHYLPRTIDDAVGHCIRPASAISCCACPIMTSTGNWSTKWGESRSCCPRGTMPARRC